MTPRLYGHPTIIAIALILISLWVSPVRAAPGDLDLGFGGDGKVTTNFTSGFDSANDVAIQQDGRIIVAGQVDPPGSGNEAFALARYNTNGTLDRSFGSDGKVTTEIAAGNDVANAVAVQPNGKIVAVGASAGTTGDTFAVARYLPDGSLDPTFSGDGMVTTSATGGGNDVAIQGDGKIVVVGIAGPSFVLTRYLRDGSLDPTFGVRGKVETAVSDWFASEDAVAIQTDGKILVAGDAVTQALWGGFVVVRYDTNGNLDATFGTDGVATVDLTRGDDWFGGVAIQTDGSIVLAGKAGFCCEFTGRFGLARLSAEGALDTTFGGDGRVITTFTKDPNIEDGAYNVAIQANGKIVAVGVAGAGWGSISTFAIARYEADGTLDKAFGINGKLRTRFPTTEGTQYYVGSWANAVAIQTNMKIVAAGAVDSEIEARLVGRFALARYLSR